VQKLPGKGGDDLKPRKTSCPQFSNDSLTTIMRRQSMKRIALVLAIVLAASFVTAWAQAEEVVIDDWFTMNITQDPETVFNVWDPVMYQVDYYITNGTPGQEYKAVIVIKSMRDILKEVEYHTFVNESTIYTTTMLNLAGSGDVGIDKTVRYQVKLKEGGTLLDRDRETSQITVNP
jgi:hypothetical protein